MRDLAFTTDRLRVAPWSDADAPWYLAAIDGDIERWTREPRGETVEAWCHRRRDVEVATDRWWSRIESRLGEPIGSLASRVVGEEIELRYWIAESRRGKGYAREALDGAVSWFRDAQAADRFRLEIHPDNVASQAVAEGAGFVFEGFAESCDTCADDRGRVAVFVRSIGLTEAAR